VIVITGLALAVAFAALGAAKVARTSSMRARAEHVGFSAESYQLIGAAEVLGAAGVAAGLVYAPVGYAAGAGLLVLLAGAVRTHLRSGDRAADLGPAVLFAAGTVAYLLALGASS
jgi:hypothetical protein